MTKANTLILLIVSSRAIMAPDSGVKAASGRERRCRKLLSERFAELAVQASQDSRDCKRSPVRGGHGEFLNPGDRTFVETLQCREHCQPLEGILRSDCSGGGLVDRSKIRVKAFRDFQGIMQSRGGLRVFSG